MTRSGTRPLFSLSSLLFTALQPYWPPSLHPTCSKLNWVICALHFLCESIFSLFLSPPQQQQLAKSSDPNSNTLERLSLTILSKVRSQCYSAYHILFGFFTVLTAIWNYFAWLFLLLLLSIGSCIINLSTVLHHSHCTIKQSFLTLYLSLVVASLYCKTHRKGSVLASSISFCPILPWTYSGHAFVPQSLHETALISVTNDPTLPNPMDNSLPIKPYLPLINSIWKHCLLHNILSFLGHPDFSCS